MATTETTKRHERRHERGWVARNRYVQIFLAPCNARVTAWTSFVRTEVTRRGWSLMIEHDLERPTLITIESPPFAPAFIETKSQ